MDIRSISKSARLRILDIKKYPYPQFADMDCGYPRTLRIVPQSNNDIRILENKNNY